MSTALARKSDLPTVNSITWRETLQSPLWLFFMAQSGMRLAVGAAKVFGMSS